MRSLRQMHGHDAYLLTVPGSETKANFLAAFSNLSKDDSQDEGKLSAALDSLLLTLIEAIDEAVSAYPEKDWPILTTVAARSLRQSLADAIRSTVEQADAQLADLRKEVA